MFDLEERRGVRERLLAAARQDPGIVAAAITGSDALGAADRWSDIDLTLAFPDRPGEVLQRWTALLYQDFAAVHHWDLPSGPTIYRVFLLPGWLEVDIAFTPEAEFGPLGPAWRTVFGHTAQPAVRQGPDYEHLVGLAWHHALHARISIERHRWWQAQYWIGALRDLMALPENALRSLTLYVSTSACAGATRLGKYPAHACASRPCLRSASPSLDAPTWAGRAAAVGWPRRCGGSALGSFAQPFDAHEGSSDQQFQRALSPISTPVQTRPPLHRDSRKFEITEGRVRYLWVSVPVPSQRIFPLFACSTSAGTGLSETAHRPNLIRGCRPSKERTPGLTWLCSSDRLCSLFPGPMSY